MSAAIQLTRISEQTTSRSGSVPAQPHSAHVSLTTADCDEFEIIEELGRGGAGIVYLARQPLLAGRLVVLKFITRTENEHLSLARLQHANIVPLFGVYDCGSDDQRALCMPFYGSVTLSHLLNELWNTPCDQRQSRDIADSLERARIKTDLATPHGSSLGASFAKTDYVHAICTIGARLADGLKYAHERGLVHLDIKPSNILLANDGQPMLLDFHLARSPVQIGDEPAQFGGTVRYMAPEQYQACIDNTENRPISVPVDVRADVFSLGVVLYEALAGQVPYAPDRPLERLHNVNPRVSVGLSDIVHKCLAVRPRDRYQTAADLAGDLRRHLADEPLCGVANRSFTEAWRKWRGRRPLLLPFFALLAALTAVVGLLASNEIAQQRRRALQLFFEGQSALQQRQFAQARDSFAEARQLAQSFGGDAELDRTASQHLQLAERAEKAEQLHRFMDRLRALVVMEPLDQRALVVLDTGCRAMWRERLDYRNKSVVLESDLEERWRSDLVELALCWSEVRMRLEVRESLEARRRTAIQVLDEAEQLCGPTAALSWLRQEYSGAARGMTKEAPSGWDHRLLGGSLLQKGLAEQAAYHLAKSVRLEPAGYWEHFSYAACCLRLGQHRQAIASLSICLGQRPLQDDCLIQRGTAYAAVKEWDLAKRDFERALQIRPNVQAVLDQLTLANHALNDQQPTAIVSQRRPSP